MYSFDDPTATSTIYGTNPTFPKGTWYSVFQPPGEQHQNIYSSSDNRFSAEVRKKYKPAYDAANTYEYCIDECTELFISKLEEMSLKGEDVDIGWWVRCYASDANGQMMVCPPPTRKCTGVHLEHFCEAPVPPNAACCHGSALAAD